MNSCQPVLFFSLVFLCSLKDGLCKSLPEDAVSKAAARKPPLITYVAGPNQLQLLFDGVSFRFGYDTNNQFRAERRFPNGSVAGYYGYIGADKVPLRVSYGAVDDLGFNAVKEVIPQTFPPETPVVTPESIPDEDAGATTLPPADEEVDQNRDSVDAISVDAISIDAANSNDKVQTFESFPVSNKRFVFPKIELDLSGLPRRSRSVNSLNEPEHLSSPDVAESKLFENMSNNKAVRHRLIEEHEPEEPAIIYATPLRYIQTVSASFATGE